MEQFKINDIVKIEKFPHENEIFIIVGEKENPWFKASPYFKNGEEIKVEDGKDFILIKKKDGGFGVFGIPKIGLHVKREEIKKSING